MIWSPRAILTALAGGDRRTETAMAVRWKRAFRDNPELAADLIRLGRIVDVRPMRFEAGQEMPDPIDPMRLAFEDGQRDLALKILAAGHIGNNELKTMMEQNNANPL